MNSAIIFGGGIKILEMMPRGKINEFNFFQNNSAPYGSNIATYPIRIAIKSNIFFLK